ncbi:MAG: DUF349 domain-containing protein, partial [Solirubrobacteraceae bacterium]
PERGPPGAVAPGAAEPAGAVADPVHGAPELPDDPEGPANDVDGPVDDAGEPDAAEPAADAEGTSATGAGAAIRPTGGVMPPSCESR